MGSVRTYTHRFTVPASLAQVGRFHSDTRALKWLTPPGMLVQFRQLEPMAEGSRASFVLWLGPIRIPWVAIHTDVSSTGFTDTQAEGPFRFWQHEHRFERVSEGETAVIDTITAELGQGVWRRGLSAFLWLTLPLLFAYRGWQTARLAPGPPD